MKKLFLLFSFVCSSLLCSCGAVTPVAYTTFVKSNESFYVSYSSDMYGLTKSHILVYKNEEESQKEYSYPDLEIRFTRTLGVDEVENVKYQLVDLSERALEMTVYINKDSELYSVSKQIFLNGTALSPYLVSDNESIIGLHYEDIDFVRTNEKGKLDYTKVNRLEYK